MRGKESERKTNGSVIWAAAARDRKSCEEAGMNGYISKPIHLKEIGKTLKEQMNQTSGRAD